MIRLLLIATLMLMQPAVAEDIKRWPFKVYLDDTEIGQHQFELSHGNSGQEIRSRAQFDVKVLFVTAYRYRHENVERWNGNCLASLTSRTNDNGDQLNVRAETQDGMLRVQSNGTSTAYALPCVMSFAYWNPAFLRATQLLHPQTGELVNVRIKHTGAEALQIGAQTVASQRYTVRGPDLRIDLWYSESGDWLALNTPVKNGRVLRYRLEKMPGCAKNRKEEVCA